MTVAELKTKIHTEFEIPANVQRWIVGKNLAERDGATLDELHAVDGSPVFLYLVAPGNLTRSNASRSDHLFPQFFTPSSQFISRSKTQWKFVLAVLSYI